MRTSVFTIGFSGNRPSDAPGRSAAELEAMRRPIERVLETYAKRLGAAAGRLELLASVAEGADTVACEVALDRGIPLHVVLPKPIDAFREDFAGSPPEAWQRSLKVIEYAQSGHNGTTFSVISPPHVSPECYQRANSTILEASDAMIILWNGMLTDKGGGAGEMLRLTQKRNIPHTVLNTLDPDQIEWVAGI